MDEKSRRGIFVGVLLIFLGVAFLAMRLIQGTIGNSLILFAIGAAFVTAYFFRRHYGLLIPGCILLGLALGSVGEQALKVDDLSLVGLGIGFVAIFVIDTIYKGRSHWWPLIPGGVLIITGVGVMSSISGFLAVGWPLLLVLVGLLLLAGAFGLFRGRKA